MDDSYRRYFKRKPNDSSVSSILTCFFFTIIGIIAGTLLGGMLKDYIHIAGEIPGPLLGIAGFAWGLSISRRREDEK
jgi:hypothetical protein